MTVAFIFILFIGLGGSLLPTWMFLNSLQLIVHLPLVATLMPSNLHMFLLKYLSFMRLKTESTDRQTEIWQRESGISGFDLVSDQDSLYSSLLLACGYKPAFSQNLFLLSLVAAVILIAIFITSMVDMICQRKGSRGLTKWICNFSTRFLYEFFFEIFLCALIHTVTLMNIEEVSVSLWIMSLLILCFVGLFIGFIASRVFTGGPYVSNSYKKRSLCKSYWGARELSAQT